MIIEISCLALVLAIMYGSVNTCRKAPPCQIATAQAPLQACLRPGLWCPGVRNLHSARETWSIKADGVDEVIDRLVAGVGNIETEENLEVHKVR